jgi:hypothetical protein
MTKEIPQPLGPVTPEERAAASRLSDQQRRAIDAALLAEVTPRWRKVALVVARAMSQPSHVVGVPDTFYGRRVCALVEAGRIEARGNVEYMRFSEVRLLPSEKDEVSPDA